MRASFPTGRTLHVEAFSRLGNAPTLLADLQGRLEQLVTAAEALEAELEAGLGACPSQVRRLVVGYEMRCYWLWHGCTRVSTQALPHG